MKLRKRTRENDFDGKERKQRAHYYLRSSIFTFNQFGSSFSIEKSMVKSVQSTRQIPPKQSKIECALYIYTERQSTERRKESERARKMVWKKKKKNRQTDERIRWRCDCCCFCCRKKSVKKAQLNLSMFKMFNVHLVHTSNTYVSHLYTWMWPVDNNAWSKLVRIDTQNKYLIIFGISCAFLQNS